MSEIPKCAHSVWRGGFTPSRCSRKAGFGPDGKFCKQHAPPEKGKEFEVYRVSTYGNAPRFESAFYAAESEKFWIRSDGYKDAKKLTTFPDLVYHRTRREALDNCILRATQSLTAARQRVAEGEAEIQALNALSAQLGDSE